MERTGLLRRTLAALAVGILLASARSAWSAPNFTPEAPVLLSSATPQSITGSYATTLRLFFIRDFQVLSATSTDGLTWSEESGVRISSTIPGNAIAFSSVTAASVLALQGGGFRMVYSVVDSTGNFSIVSATSSDGLAWANEAGVRVAVPAATFAGSTRLLKISATGWQLFYIQASSGTDPTTFRIFLATSGTEGQTWSAGAQVFSAQARDVAPMALTNGKTRLIYTVPASGQSVATQFLSAISGSPAGTIFAGEAAIRLSTAVGLGEFSSPQPFRAPEDFRWRLYHAFTASGSTTPVTLGALTQEPDPQLMLPNTVLRSDPAATFSVTGEVFSSTVTALLRKSGETDIPGASLARTSDQALSVSFDTQGRALGAWDLVITNGDAAAGVLSRALTIDFQPAILNLTDNVMRPLGGQKTHFDVTVFDSGRLTVKIYTLEGRLVRTVFDADVPVGTIGFDWDGRTDDGRLVASGTYFSESIGPKLDQRKKIVVIK